MLRGHDIVCFANDWDGDPLSKKHVMTPAGAPQPRAVGQLDSATGGRAPRPRDLRRAAGKIAPLRPRPAPGRGGHPRLPAARRAVLRQRRGAAGQPGSPRRRPAPRRQEARLRRRRSPGPSYPPRPTSPARSASAWWSTTASTSSRSSPAPTAPRSAAMERRLLDRADLVIVSAERLLETKRAHNPNVHLVTHGVDVEHFRRACSARDPGARRAGGAARAGDRILRPDRRLGRPRAAAPGGAGAPGLVAAPWSASSTPTRRRSRASPTSTSSGAGTTASCRPSARASTSRCCRSRSTS